jgi:hypothetical protein
MSEDSHPLNAREIAEGYMSTDVSRAARNARTIAWLAKQPVETLDNIRMLVAGEIQCPLDETVPLDSGSLDDETLTHVYTWFASQIDRTP